MNVFQLNCFLSVAEHMSFAKAAAELHVTHPAVSQQIRSLEKELGVLLFQRTTRSVKLTEEGKSFLYDAQQMVLISQRAKNRFANTAREELQFLTIGCSSFPCMYHLTELLRRLHSCLPCLHPNLRVIPFQHIYRMLDEGELDVVASFQEPPSAKLSARYKELDRVPLALICPPDHPLARKNSVSTQEISAEPLVLFEPPRTFSPIVQLQGELIGQKDPSELHFCGTAEAISVLVAAGYGVSLLPELLLPDAPDLVRVPVENLEPLSFGLYYHSAQGKAALKALLRCAGDARTK